MAPFSGSGQIWILALHSVGGIGIGSGKSSEGFQEYDFSAACFANHVLVLEPLELLSQRLASTSELGDRIVARFDFALKPRTSSFLLVI